MPPRSRAKSTDGNTPELGQRRPIADAYEAYLLTRMMDARIMAAKLQTMLPEAGVETELGRLAREEIAAQKDSAERRWRSFIDRACSSEAERAGLSALGQPDSIEVDTDVGVPMAVWDEASRDVGGFWPANMIVAIASGDTRFTPTQPFREVRLASLPEGTRFVQISEPRHAATAAIAEVLRAVKSDMDVHIRQASPSIAWRRLAYLVAFYNTAIKVIGPSLSDDEFRDWQRNLSDLSRPIVAADQLARMVAGSARTCRAQQLVAVQLVAAPITDSMTAVEDAHYDAGEEMWVQHVAGVIDRASHAVGEAMRGYNIAAMAFSGCDDTTASPMTMLRPVPHGLPRLAVIPRGDQVTPLPV
jgi:hypothetical protein